MAHIHVQAEQVVNAAPEEVYTFLNDYTKRQQILTENYLNYKVEEGGNGAGTVVTYRFMLLTVSGAIASRYRTQVQVKHCRRVMQVHHLSQSGLWHLKQMDRRREFSLQAIGKAARVLAASLRRHLPRSACAASTQRY